MIYYTSAVARMQYSVFECNLDKAGTKKFSETFPSYEWCGRREYMLLRDLPELPEENPCDRNRKAAQ